MVTQAQPIAAACSCALPEPAPGAVFQMKYLVTAPDELTLRDVKAHALAIVADAGLSPMPISVQHDLGTDDEVMWRLYAHEAVFDTIVVYTYAGTSAEVLANFSRELGIWARKTGKLPAAQTMEGSQRHA